VRNLTSLLEHYIGQNRPFDFARKIQYFALDVISEIALGEPFGDLTTDSDVHNLIEDFSTYLPYLIVSTVMSWMIPIMGLPIFRPFMPSEHDVLGIGRLMGLVMVQLSRTQGLLANTSRRQNCETGCCRAIRTWEKGPKGHGWLVCCEGVDQGTGRV
jgi:hypothetical protein